MQKLRSKSNDGISSTRVQNEVSQSSNTSEEQGPCDSTVPDYVTSTETPGPSGLTVKLKFPTKRCMKSKVMTQLQIAKKKMKFLNEQVDKLNRRNSCLRKRLSRLKKKKVLSKPVDCINSESDGQIELLTPKSRTRAEVRNLNMTPLSRKNVTKQLQFHNCMLEAVKKSLRPKKKNNLYEWFVATSYTNIEWKVA